MIELRSQHIPREMFDKEILDCVLGCYSIGLKGWARSPSTSTQTNASDSSTNHSSYVKLASQLFAIQDRLCEVEEILRLQGLMPPSPPTHASDQHSRPAV